MSGMDIPARITVCEQKFEQLKGEREQHIQTSNNLLEEMNKLQGEWRLLQEFLKMRSRNF